MGVDLAFYAMALQLVATVGSAVGGRPSVLPLVLRLNARIVLRYITVCSKLFYCWRNSRAYAVLVSVARLWQRAAHDRCRRRLVHGACGAHSGVVSCRRSGHFCVGDRTISPGPCWRSRTFACNVLIFFCLTVGTGIGCGNCGGGDRGGAGI